MRTRQRNPAHAARHSLIAVKSKPAAEVQTPRTPSKQLPAFWWVTAAIYFFAAAALLLLPAGITQTSAEASAAFEKAADRILNERGTSYYFLGDLWNSALDTLGMSPARPAWVPSGVDYGNTRVPLNAEGKLICLAWQYRPRSLSSVPDGVNVLAPTWFYVEDADGTAEVNELSALRETKITNWQPLQYVKAAHEGGAKVWASVVCIGTPGLAKQVVCDAACRSLFISRIAGWVQEYGLDGINFDFEKMDPADKEAYTAFIAACKQALPPGKTVSVDVTVPLDNPEGNWWQCYDRAGLGRAADYVAVMAYDNPDVEPVAAIGWVSGKTKDMLELVPAEKLLLGVPFYGVDFLFDTPGGGGGTLTELPPLVKSKARKTMTPSGIQSLLEKGSYTSGGKDTSVDYWIEKGEWQAEQAVMRYAYLDADGLLHVAYCEDERSLEAKGRLSAFERLAGAAVWRMEFGQPRLWGALTRGMDAIR